MSWTTTSILTTALIAWLILGYGVLMRGTYQEMLAENRRIVEIATTMIKDPDSPCHESKTKFYRKVGGDETLKCKRYEREMNLDVRVVSFDAMLVSHNWCASGHCTTAVYNVFAYVPWIVCCFLFLFCVITLCSIRVIIEECTRQKIRTYDQAIPISGSRRHNERKYMALDSVYGKSD